MSAGMLRRNLSDAVFLFALPITAALLPWRFGFALLRRVARSQALFADVVNANLAVARQHLTIADEADFAWRCRLFLLVDRCDSYLTLLRSAHWWQAQVRVSGDDALGRGLLLTGHWGAGFWIWRVLAARGVRAHFLVRRAGVGDVGRGLLSRAYLAWRGWCLPRVGSAGAIFAGGSGERVRVVLADGGAVLGMLDLPAATNQRSVRVPWIAGDAALPIGLADIAVQAGAPIYVVLCGLDVANGTRRLHIEALPPALDANGVVCAYARALRARIEGEPAAWHLWSALPAFAAATAAPDASA